MKTRTYLGLLICGLLISNCSQEDNNLISEGNYSIITASIESAAKTRSTVTEGGKFAWAEGDKISVQQQTGGFATYVYGNDSQFALDSQETPATLSGVAYYPANENHTSAVFILPAEYNLEGNTKNTNAPMIASVEEGTTDFSFKHMGGVLRFIFRNVPAEANKFVFTTTDKAIAGEFNVVTESGTQVIKTVDASSSNNTITINFNAGQSTEMTFYVPMPIGTYNSMSVAFYNNATELWYASSTAENTINRASLLLMPPLNCTKNASTVSNAAAVNNALEKVPEDEPEASVNLSGEAVQMTEITIPESFTDAATEESNLNLTYNDVPTADEAITISDANTSAEQSDSKGNVNISIPNVADESEAPSFNINLPTMTVTLQANVENATYNEVTASTAKNTLRIAKGVTVKKLILNGGNIVIEEGATVNAVVNKQGFEGKTYVVTLGTLTNNPNLDNVTVVDSEDDIPSYELRVLTFEDADAKFSAYTITGYDGNDYYDHSVTKWSDLIDTPEYGGPLAYGDMGYSGEGRGCDYNWYDNNNTFLASEFPVNYYSKVYWGGGHVISNYATEDYTTYGTYENQQTVYGARQEYGVTKTGGRNGSSNFAMHFGYIDGSPYNMTENLPYIYFKDNTPRIIDHMYVNNSAYAISCYMDGNGLTAKISEEDWVKAIATGYDIDDNVIGTAEIYLCNGPDNIVTEWTKWDLTSLGMVYKVEFNITGSSDNGYGFSQPAYFAYDDVAVRFEK